ncbi:hypothetical protein ACFLW1_02045 [Chloroflexota bacterium]
MNSTAAARINGYLSGHGTADQFAREIGLLGLSEKGQELLIELAGRSNPALCGITP